ncbi:aminotransferase class I/II-fold pyridoxal phosphate-dependent enzyme [Phenylobacterium terrae]|uniref:Aminotransferase class I/II-fold pyridoxal phosphate-dependent enzyme n=1 Tax=Phenylobacterium terrae TaxID=2665495 RepID=A0ABW4N3G7_9CAUL
MIAQQRIPLCVPNVGEAERAYLNRCIDDNFVSSVGPFVGEFESRLAEVTGGSGAVTTGSGTQALRLSLHLVGVGPGDLVVMPAFTFIATANAAWQAGAGLALLDVEPEGWTLDPAELAAFLEEDCRPGPAGPEHKASGRRVGAVIPVYTFGVAPRMREIQAICQAHGVPLVADAAAALGTSTEQGALAELADLTCLSFNGNKIITTGCGGALLGRRADLLQRGRHLASTARLGAEYDHDEPAFNYRMSNMQAGIGLAQLDRLPEFVARKRQVRAAYDAAAAASGRASGFPEPSWSRSNAWFSGVVLSGADGPQAAQAVLRRLQAAGVEARPFWKPLHLQRPYLEAQRRSLANTDDLWGRLVTLPSSTGLTDAQLGACVEALSRTLAEL